MALLAEYALTPDVFDVTSYNGDDVCSARLERVKDVLLEEGLVRDLRNGDWARLFANDQRHWHLGGRELLKQLKLQGRLVRCEALLPTNPKNEAEWCDEALKSHEKKTPLAGIIVSRGVADSYRSEPMVACVDRLGSAPWWGCGPSRRLDRKLTDYQAALNLVLRHAKSIMFIDPHIDPVENRYKDFITLLQGAGNRSSQPLIEIHRVCYRGSGKHRKILDLEVLENEFRRELRTPLANVGLGVNVFVWDDFHDRYVVSNLVGISVPAGFDTTKSPRAKTTWTRMSRLDCDDVRNEFHPNFERHKIKHNFTIP